jgi:hypothetical protein
MESRPNVVQALILQLCTVWGTNPRLAIPFISFFPNLLVYREPVFDNNDQIKNNIRSELNDGDFDHHALTETIFTVTESSKVLGIDKFHNRQITRILLLDFLESHKHFQDSEFVSCIHSVITDLINRNKKKSLTQAAMIGTEPFIEKLRCWQSLCILSPYVTQSLLLNILDVCFDSLLYPCAHGIRVHIEIFLAAMAAKYSEIILPRLLDLLLVFNHTQQVL